MKLFEKYCWTKIIANSTLHRTRLGKYYLLISRECVYDTPSRGLWSRKEKSGHNRILKLFKKTDLAVEKIGLHTHQRRILLRGPPNPLDVPISDSEIKNRNCKEYRKIAKRGIKWKFIYIKLAVRIEYGYNQSWWDYRKEKKAKERGPLSIWIKKTKAKQNPPKPKPIVPYQ